LDAVMPAWLAALIIAVVYAAVAAVLALRGRDRVKQALPPVPEQTIETVKEDMEWAKTQMPSVKK
jgi:Putative Actinobacterial Holin-X, holin superfamily III